MSNAIADLDRQYVWHPFTHHTLWNAAEPLVITDAEGVYLIDSSGRRYIDGVASLWCNVHGHRVPEIDAAIEAQLKRVAHTTLLGLTNEPATLLAQRLIALAPPGLARAFYSDSGATATEIAFKMAAQYWYNRGRPEKCEFVGLTEAYHGDTVGAMSVGMTTSFHKPYMPLLFKVHYAPAPIPSRAETAEDQPSLACDCALRAMEKILREHASRIAAICIEPHVMGAAGIVVQPPGFVRGVRELADRYDVLLICDEVATGFGRTGRMFACEIENISPDLLCLGKGISGGYLPLAATLATSQIFESFLGQPWEGKTFFHGHTYTGNPLACAAALASLDLFERHDLLSHVRTAAEQLLAMLEPLARLPHVGGIRQLGLMVGIDLVSDSSTRAAFNPRLRTGAAVCDRLRHHGIVLRPLGDTIVLMPPLVITPAQLQEIVDALRVEIGALGAGTSVSVRGDEQVAGDF
jgi:adenosylmethionine-8-amino-7-oxononanoate aminotransferase